MNPIPIIIVVLCVLAFETELFGEQVAQSIKPFTLTVDTAQRECGTFAGIPDFGCHLSNAFRPVLGGIAYILNGLLFVGALATFSIPGAPMWAKTTLTLGLNFCLIWSVVALLRGVK